MTVIYKTAAEISAVLSAASGGDADALKEIDNWNRDELIFYRMVVDNAAASKSLQLTKEPEYEFYTYWAEESSTLSTNAWEWSWGNGDEGAVGLPIGSGYELISMSFHADKTASGQDDMEVSLYDIKANDRNLLYTLEIIDCGDGVNDNMHSYEDLRSNPILIPDGAVLAFRSGVEVGNIEGARVGIEVRRKTGREIVVDAVFS